MHLACNKHTKRMKRFWDKQEEYTGGVVGHLIDKIVFKYIPFLRETIGWV